MGIGVTVSDYLEAARASVAAVREVLPISAPVVVGGLAVRDEAHALAMGADGWAPDGRSLVVLLDHLVGGAWPPAEATEAI